jgi:hypothetical protein
LIPKYDPPPLLPARSDAACRLAPLEVLKDRIEGIELFQCTIVFNSYMKSLE